MIIKINKNASAFTIVELLVVIVVIGILAAITIVAYTGISQKAIQSSLQSDLTSAQNQLKLYQVDNMAYPNSVIDCPTPTAGNGNICLKSSPGNSYSNYSASNSTNPQTFTLTVSNGNISYVITNNTSPALVSAPTFSASGGTITYTDSSGQYPRYSPAYTGGYTVHTFTSSGTFTANGTTTGLVLVVGGGGGGGKATGQAAGGGGAQKKVSG